MARSVLIHWDCRSTGSDTNGGGFKQGASGTDFSQQAAAQYALTNGQTQGTAVILFAGPTSRTYTVPQVDSVLIVATGNWTPLPSVSNPFRRGDYLIWTVVGNDLLRVRFDGP